MLNDIAGLRFQVEDLREWRAELRTQLESLIERYDELAAQIGDVVKADEIADEVTKRMKETNTLRLSFVQKAAVFVVALTGLGASIRTLIGG